MHRKPTSYRGTPIMDKPISIQSPVWNCCKLSKKNGLENGETKFERCHHLGKKLERWWFVRMAVFSAPSPEPGRYQYCSANKINCLVRLENTRGAASNCHQNPTYNSYNNHQRPTCLLFHTFRTAANLQTLFSTLPRIGWHMLQPIQLKLHYCKRVERKPNQLEWTPSIVWPANNQLLQFQPSPGTLIFALGAGLTGQGGPQLLRRPGRTGLANVGGALVVLKNFLNKIEKSQGTHTHTHWHCTGWKMVSLISSIPFRSSN